MNLKLYPMDRQTCALKIASCKLFSQLPFTVVVVVVVAVVAVVAVVG